MTGVEKISNGCSMVITTLNRIRKLSNIGFFIILLPIMCIVNMWIPMTKKNIAIAGNSDPNQNDEPKIESINYMESKKVVCKKKTQIQKKKRPINNSYQAVLYRKLNNNDETSESIPNGKVIQSKAAIEKNQNNNQDNDKQVEKDVILTSFGNFFVKMFESSAPKADQPHVPTEPSNQTDQSAISGVSISNISYVTLSNGKKIFEGGKLDNGCIIETIHQNNVILNCNGRKRKQTL